MSDIVERLRLEAAQWISIMKDRHGIELQPDQFILNEAATLISQLRNRLSDLEGAIAAIADDLDCKGKGNAHYCPNCDNSLYDALQRARAASPSPPWTHRHKKRGTLYRVICKATLQCVEYEHGGHDGSNALSDMDEMTVYQAEDGTLWVRSTAEFEDGRFEVIA